MKKLKVITGDKRGAFTVSVWHKDGVVLDVKGVEVGKVYFDGKLAKTRRVWEMITIVLNR